MYSLTYAIKHIYRSFIKCFSMMCIVLAFILLFCYFSNSIKIQEEKLDITYKSIPILVEVSDYRGNNRDNLALSENNIEYFTKESYGLSKYLKDVSLRRDLNVLEINGVEKLEFKDPFILIGVTNFASIEKQYTDNGFDFEAVFNEGLDYSMFSKSTDSCLINEELLEKIGKKPGDIINITLKTKETIHSARDQFENLMIQPVEAKFMISGVIKGGKINEIYCSWDKSAELGRKSDNSGVKYSDILRATINDNYKLNGFKAAAKKHYVSAGSKTFSGTSYYALTTYDDTFIKAVSQIQKNIQFLKSVYPVIILFSFVIGYLVSFLFTRNRKKEVAVMRSLGASRFRVFITIMLELFTINILGTLIGVLVCYYILSINVTINEISLFLYLTLLVQLYQQ